MREAQSQNKDLSRQVQELLAIRHQLEADRDRLATELNDANEALRDAQARLEAANAALSQLRIDFEHRLREKDEEIENVRSIDTDVFNSFCPEFQNRPFLVLIFGHPGARPRAPECPKDKTISVAVLVTLS